MKHGAYILANDVTVEWLEACLRSLRHFEPKLPVLILPFDDRLELTARVAARHGASIWSDPSLPELDRLGATLAERYVEIRYFRKLATFWGPFDRFLYLDADIVVLGPYLRLWLDALERDGSDFAYYNSDMDQVFRPGPMRVRMEAAGSHGFNAGFFLARRGAVTFDTVRSAFREALDTVDLGAAFTWNVEQGFLNWLAVRERWRVRALLELEPRFAPISWYRCRLERRGDRYVQPWEGEDRPAGILHWAGLSAPFLPHHDLFLRFRLLGEPLGARLRYRIRWYLRLLAKGVRGRLRS